MKSARSYECPNCGGVVRETARECRYCHSPVATVRCARCFAMNVVEAVHCMSCGTELGLMPVPAEHGDARSGPSKRSPTERRRSTTATAVVDSSYATPIWL